jgi:hypothetical protein
VLTALGAMVVVYSCSSTSPGARDASRDDRISDAAVSDADIADRPGADIADRPGADISVDGDNTAASCWPPCLASLEQHCSLPLVGSCVQQGNSSCFSNGIRETVVNEDGGGSVFTLFNGTGLCATVTLAGGTYVFRDGTGAIVATITEMQPGVPFSDATVACDGSETVVPGSLIRSPACMTIQAGDCTPGTCP